MILVDTCATNLVAGYDKIREFEEQLPGKWRQRVLAAYARRRNAHSAALAAHRRKMDKLTPRLWGGLAVAGSVFLLALCALASSEWIGLKGDVLSLLSCLTMASMAGMGLVGVTWFWQAVVRAPKLPAHPLRGSLKAHLFPLLLPLWRDRLQGALKVPDYEGAVGERDFVRQLVILPERSTYIVYRLQQRPGDDVDVTVVGPRGVWVFEVKYWSGKIAWRSGQWAREKSYYAPGRVWTTEPVEITQPPDRQWQRMADDVAETLRRRAAWLVARQSAAAQVRGGLAFTHPKALYDIAPGCPVVWGPTSSWMVRVTTAPIISGLGERDVLQILDALLARHRQVAGDGVTRSMDGLAEDIARQAETRLMAWIQDGR